MVGLVFAKMAGPKKRALTLIFSKNACGSLRDGALTFLFRVGDMRDTHLVEAHIRLQMIMKRVRIYVIDVDAICMQYEKYQN